MLLGRVANAALRKRLILAELRCIGRRDPVLWINDHGAGHLAGQLSESAVIYDITDDWTACESNPRYRKVIEKQDRTLCDKADVVMVCSEHLHNLKRRFVPQERLHLVLNGVHAEHYSRVLKDEESLPEVAASWASPFWGIPEPFIPTGLTWNSCESWPEHRASERSLLVGPNHLRPSDLKRLQLSNIILTGPTPYKEVPDLMRAFDVCIVPHKVTPFTESLNPIKLWEYLAAGKPIVATDLAGFRDFPISFR